MKHLVKFRMVSFTQTEYLYIILDFAVHVYVAIIFPTDLPPISDYFLSLFALVAKENKRVT